MARMTAKDRLGRLAETAKAAISYVEQANYDYRARAAQAAVRKSLRTGKFVAPEDMEKE